MPASQYFNSPSELDEQLHIAARHGNSLAVELLIEEGANIESRDDDNITLLMRACFFAREQEVELLLRHKAKIDHLIIFYAVAGGSINIVKCLLEAGCDINAQDAENSGATALHIASEQGDIAMVKFLLSCGADVKARTAQGYTPLMISFCNDHEEVMELLIEESDKLGIEPEEVIMDCAIVLDHLYGEGEDEEAALLRHETYNKSIQ